MSQTKQVKKIKRYRVLKVVFYSLGLPLFMLATLFTAIRFIGHDPFVGTATFTGTLDFFMDYEAALSSSALFGLWIAVGVWLVISILHLILSKAVKSRKARMVAVTAIVLVVMLGGVIAMDVVFTSEINAIAENAPAGVTVDDYKTQLSYYSVVSSAADSRDLTKSLLDRVAQYEKVYNLQDFYGQDKTGTAGNTANKPVTYDDLIDDNGKKATYDETQATQLVRVAPNANGELVIGDQTFSHYFYIKRSGANVQDFYVWYTKDMMPTGFTWDGTTGSVSTTDGEYGVAMYNANGMLSDGWVFSFDNMLRILEAYYDAPVQIDELYKTYSTNSVDGIKTTDKDANYTKMHDKAVELLDAYYNGGFEYNGEMQVASAWEQALYDKEFEARFSITEDELNDLFKQIVALIGKNNLFDYLFKNDGMSNLIKLLNNQLLSGLTGSITPILSQLTTGISLKGLAGEANWDLVKAVVEMAAPGNTVQEDVLLRVTYENNLKIILFENETTFLEVDLSETPTLTGEELTLDKLSDVINQVLNGVLANDTLKSLLDMVLTNVGDGKGLAVAGMQIQLLDKGGNAAVNLGDVLGGLLNSMYYYQSPVIKNFWDFYEMAWAQTIGANSTEIAKQYARLEKAEYTGSTYGTLIGSTLIGDTLGTGNYDASMGLTNLADVQQLITDLEYQPVYFPIYAAREMMIMFSGLVVVFYLLSFLYAEKEEKAMKMLLANSEGNTATPVEGNN